MFRTGWVYGALNETEKEDEAFGRKRRVLEAKECRNFVTKERNVVAETQKLVAVVSETSCNLLEISNTLNIVNK